MPYKLNIVFIPVVLINILISIIKKILARA